MLVLKCLELSELIRKLIIFDECYFAASVEKPVETVYKWMHIYVDYVLW